MPEPSPGFLDAAALERLSDLHLQARLVVDGALAGLHRSPHHGASVEFAEHKEYSPGDEVRHIDWKAFGKFDKYYVKRFEEETELRGYLVLDCSASMGYTGAGVSKLRYAAQLAAALGYLLVRQQDQAGMLAFAEGLRHYLPPRGRPSHLGDLLNALRALEPSGRTDLGRAVDYLSEVARRRAMVVLFSDLFDSEPAAPGVPRSGGGGRAMQLLRGLRARRHDVVLFHMLDADELHLPEERFSGLTRFVGLEDTSELVADPRAVRQRYLEAVAAFVAECRRSAAEGDVEYHLVDTARPPAEVLMGFLRGRARARLRMR
ncbi:MAG TPA: DUF58 domain-containing protein [Polyangia bacterium]|nr:DUF58 domain-containing protein [Polyangia bacterium]